VCKIARCFRIRSPAVIPLEEFYIRPIPEEVFCNHVVSAVEHWIQQVKRQLMVGESVSLENVFDFFVIE
jgi:hypothetical protein